MAKKLFCERNPLFFHMAVRKNIIQRHLENIFSGIKFSKNRSRDKLPVLIYSHNNELIKTGKGIDPVLQENKAININIACKEINGMIINPGEVFSLFKTIGNTTKRKGYKDGRVIDKKKGLTPGIGGGLCNLANSIHLLAVHSPMKVVEFHQHSDALAPDNGKRVPLSSGTSISYNYIDYRFKNTSNQPFQLLTWCEDGKLWVELRSSEDIPNKYKIVEEDHHFSKEGEKYFRISKIYRETIDKKTEKTIAKELLIDNHSEVMFDYDLIPKEQIK